MNDQGDSSILKTVLVTGATGFVGRHLCAHLTSSGYSVRAAVRSVVAPIEGAVETVVVGDIRSTNTWAQALAGVGQVVHCAAMAHVMDARSSVVERYLETNALATGRLATACAQAGVRRLVFLSSIKVNGERTDGASFTPESVPNPQDPYGVSKCAGERVIAEISDRSGLESVSIRTPLVYGPGVRANFLRLMRWVDRGIPLPLGGIANCRSIVSIWNLCDLIERLVSVGSPPPRVLMVSDGEDISTPELIRRLARTMRRPVRLLGVPPLLLRATAGLIGRQAEMDRLCESLRVDIAATRATLKWDPPVSLDESLRRTVEWYIGARNRS